jgi:hypothetical protein
MAMLLRGFTGLPRDALIRRLTETLASAEWRLNKRASPVSRPPLRRGLEREMAMAARMIPRAEPALVHLDAHSSEMSDFVFRVTVSRDLRCPAARLTSLRSPSALPPLSLTPPPHPPTPPPPPFTPPSADIGGMG